MHMGIYMLYQQYKDKNRDRRREINPIPANDAVLYQQQW